MSAVAESTSSPQDSSSLNFRLSTARELLQRAVSGEDPCLSLGCQILDAFLRGGLRKGVTELAGESACGKTQFALQLLLQAQLPVEQRGLNSASFYLCTEDLPITRLKQLAEAYNVKYPWTAEYDFCQNVFIERVTAVEDFLDVLFHRLPTFLEKRRDIRLIVIDSIASVLRTEFEQGEYSDRATLLFSIGSQLAQLASAYSCIILVINQVTDKVQNEEYKLCPSSTNSSVCLSHWSVRSSGRLVTSSLGLSWAHCVNTRLFLSRELSSALPPFDQPTSAVIRSTPAESPVVAATNRIPQPSANHSCATPPPSSFCTLPNQPSTHCIRKLHVIFSSYLPCSNDSDSVDGACPFIISHEGVRGV